MPRTSCSGGENIHPLAAEEVRAGHSEALGVAAIDVHHKMHGEIPAGPRGRSSASGLDPETLVDRALMQPARFKVPNAIDFRQDFPWTATAIARKIALRGYAEPRAPISMVPLPGFALLIALRYVLCRKVLRPASATSA